MRRSPVAELAVSLMSVRPAEANMPILNRLSRNLSPLGKYWVSLCGVIGPQVKVCGVSVRTCG